MRSLMKKIDLFCYRHPRFGIPRLMLIVVIGNLAVWLLSAMDTTGLLTGILRFSAAGILRGEVWRLVTFVFLPESSGIWLIVMLYFYYFIGNALESEWGTGRFTIYYLMGMALTVLYGFAAYFITGRDFSLSVSYINLSMFFAFATLYPNVQVLLFFVIPLKVKWLAVADAALFAYEIFSMLGQGWGMMSFLPLVAVLNYFIFCGDWLFSMVLPRGKQQRKNTVDFKREVHKIKYEQKNAPYTRRCEVCGRTDADYPDLEFRYCSRCQGYHCFCQDHINNHSHFTS